MQRQQDQLRIKRIALVEGGFHAMVDAICILSAVAGRELFMPQDAIGHQRRGFRQRHLALSVTGKRRVKLDHGQFDGIRHKKRMHARGSECIINGPQCGRAAQHIKQAKHRLHISGLWRADIHISPCRRRQNSYRRFAYLRFAELWCKYAGRPTKLQQAFIEKQAAHYGFCAFGMIMAAWALLDSNPTPSDAEVRQALNGHLCRCGTHNRIVRAVLRAADEA